MTKIKIETYKTKKQEIPVKRIGGLALVSDAKEVRREEYLRSDKKQDHGSRPAYRYKDKSEKTLADKRAEALGEVSKLPSSQLLLLANEILAQEVYDENGQRFPERQLAFSSEDYDGDDEASGMAELQDIEGLMGATVNLDTSIRESRLNEKRRREQQVTLADNIDDDKPDFVLDGLNIKSGRPNQ